MGNLSIWYAENERNASSRQLFVEIIKEAHGAEEVGVGHHMMFSVQSVHDELPSADMLIFDHDVAKKLWGDNWQSVLTQLALIPISERDARLAELYYGRSPAASCG